MAYAYAFFSYHGHPGDVSRYLLPVSAFVRLTVLLACLWGFKHGRAVWAARSVPGKSGTSQPRSS